MRHLWKKKQMDYGVILINTEFSKTIDTDGLCLGIISDSCDVALSADTRTHYKFNLLYTSCITRLCPGISKTDMSNPPAADSNN